MAPCLQAPEIVLVDKIANPAGIEIRRDQHQTWVR